MKSLHRILALTGVAASLVLASSSLHAQGQTPRGQGGQPGGQPGGGRGNFSPEEFRQRMMDRYREAFEVKDDEEWKLISERITKVSDAQRATRTGGGFGFGRPPGGGAPGGGAPGGGGNGDNNGGGRTRNRGGGGGPGGTTGGFGGGTPDPEVEALQKAIEAKASPDELKAKLARVRDARKDKEAKLEKAQDELRQVLSARQEAVAVVMGLLK